MLRKFYDKLIDHNWFYTFTASATATIVGISLTLGINSCRDSQRKKTEAEKSIMEAVGNIGIRIDQLNKFHDLLESQNRIYAVADSIHKTGEEIPDSICSEFKTLLSSFNFYISDHGFEKVFRESYQLWQVLDQDMLTRMVNANFEMLSSAEPLCAEMLNSLLDQIAKANNTTPFVGKGARTFTEIMLNRPEFAMYMAIRMSKTSMIEGFCAMLDHAQKRCVEICDELEYTQVMESESETFNWEDDGNNANVRYEE